MTTRYERDIFLFLSLYRFFAYGLAVVLIQVVPLDTAAEPSLRSYIYLGLLGFYTLLKVLGPLRWWKQDPATYVVLAGDVLVCTLMLLLTGGLNSPYLLYSLVPVVTSALLFREEQALLTATVLSASLVVAHITPIWWHTDYTWVMQQNYLLWLILYIIGAFAIVTSVHRTNLNIRQHIETDAVREERRRMRQEIHDGLAQTLTYLSMRVDAAGKLVAQERLPEAGKALSEIYSLTRESYQEVREYINQLATDSRAPLVPTLSEYVEAFGQRNSIQAHFTYPSTPLRLLPTAEFQLLRIAQEALTNVWRHAQASEAWVTLETTPRTVELAVRDNGRGFATSKGQEGETVRHGLAIMQERAKNLGGSLNITSTPGQGTEVHVSIPRSGGRT